MLLDEGLEVRGRRRDIAWRERVVDDDGLGAMISDEGDTGTGARGSVLTASAAGPRIPTPPRLATGSGFVDSPSASVDPACASADSSSSGPTSARVPTIQRIIRFYESEPRRHRPLSRNPHRSSMPR